jgi:hypothetical protein
LGPAKVSIERLWALGSGVKPQVAAFCTVLEKDEAFLKGYVADVAAQDMKAPWQLVLAATDERLLQEAKEMFEEVRRPSNKFEVVLVHMSEDPGLYETWDFLVHSVASADFVSNWNIDDRKHPSSLSKKASVMEAQPDVYLVTAGSVAQKDPNASWGSKKWTDQAHVNSETDPNDWWELWYTRNGDTELWITDMVRFDDKGEVVSPDNPPHASPMWRRSMHAEKEIGTFSSWNKDGAMSGSCSDWALWTRALLAGKKMWRIGGPLELYLIRMDSHERAYEPKGSTQREKCEGPMLERISGFLKQAAA